MIFYNSFKLEWVQLNGEKQSEKAFSDQRFTSQGHYLVFGFE